MQALGAGHRSLSEVAVGLGMRKWAEVCGTYPRSMSVKRSQSWGREGGRSGEGFAITGGCL